LRRTLQRSFLNSAVLQQALFFEAVFKNKHPKLLQTLDAI
jgi:hypothetical protein